MDRLQSRLHNASFGELVAAAIGLINGLFFQLACRCAFKRISCGPWLRIHGKVIVKGPGRILIGKNCLLLGDVIKPICLRTLAKNSNIIIGNNVGISGTTIQCAREVSIGDDCAIAAHYVTDSQNHSMGVDRRTNPGAPIKTASVTLERNVWVSVLTTILHGVRIGENSVIGANSLVLKDIPANVFAAGNPAQIIRQLD